MKNDRRTFYLYNIEIASKKEGASLPTMQQLMNVWHKMRQGGRTYPINAGEGTMLVGDVRFAAADQYMILLLRLSDKKAPNSVYSDPTNGQFTEHPKVGNVGSDFACHVLISTAPEAGLPNIHTCAIERVTNINAGLVQRILSKFLNYEYHENSSFFSYPAPGGGLTREGQPRMERCCPHIELRGRPSAALINDINTGHLSGISLIKQEPVLPIAGAPYLKKSQTELKLTIDRGNLPNQLWNSLEQAMQANSGAYGAAKISYKKPGSTRIVTVELNAATGQPLNDMYIESFDVGPIFPPLAQSTDVVVPRLITPAVTQFLTYRAI
ncbi:hypothetical protein [Agrobacterium tumefaciens]|uniref:hypothetical protein n=1 Tax=Agrobacterium tumefaciens TaxID=358 RepID=UPI00104F3E0C|nr:hypothetical protein [Agrobacterium tumefaciens]TCV55159.1 hypothetical protein EDB97_101251 [Agrobacterium tumefaciens]